MIALLAKPIGYILLAAGLIGIIGGISAIRDYPLWGLAIALCVFLVPSMAKAIDTIVERRDADWAEMKADIANLKTEMARRSEIEKVQSDLAGVQSDLAGVKENVDKLLHLVEEANGSNGSSEESDKTDNNSA